MPHTHLWHSQPKVGELDLYHLITKVFIAKVGAHTRTHTMSLSLTLITPPDCQAAACSGGGLRPRPRQLPPSSMREDKQVCGLDVPVNEAGRVHVPHTQDHLRQ